MSNESKINHTKKTQKMIKKELMKCKTKKINKIDKNSTLRAYLLSRTCGELPSKQHEGH